MGLQAVAFPSSPDGRCIRPDRRTDPKRAQAGVPAQIKVILGKYRPMDRQTRDAALTIFIRPAKRRSLDAQ